MGIGGLGTVALAMPAPPNRRVPVVQAITRVLRIWLLQRGCRSTEKDRKRCCEPVSSSPGRTTGRAQPSTSQAVHTPIRDNETLNGGIDQRTCTASPPLEARNVVAKARLALDTATPAAWQHTGNRAYRRPDSRPAYSRRVVNRCPSGPASCCLNWPGLPPPRHLTPDRNATDPSADASRMFPALHRPKQQNESTRPQESEGGSITVQTAATATP